MHAQYPHDSKRDNVWGFGYGYYLGQTDTLFGLTWLNYSNVSPTVVREYSDIDFFDTNAMGCDQNGEPQIITNGLFAFNKLGQPIQGGDTLNPGYWAEQVAMLQSGYIVPQGALILPLPGNQDKYYLFHSSMSNVPNSYSFYDVKGVYYTVIDMEQNSGLGFVDSLRQPISNLGDTIDYGKLTACRHGNGRDWWVLFCSSSERKYRRILLDIYGLHDYGWVLTGLNGIKYTGIGQAVFTSYGNHYVNYNVTDKVEGEFLDVYDFDRCIGALSNPVRINTMDSCSGAGLAGSPNGRYIYTTCGTRIFQYDLEATDTFSNKTVVAEWDGFIDPDFSFGATYFYLMGNTPDGKILVSTPNGTRYLHTIENPDQLGLSCNVTQHNVHLYTFNSRSMPNYPNFRLGPVDGSACDTLGIDVVGIDDPIKQTTMAASIQVYPNPATSYCNVGFGTTLKQNGQLIVYNSAGQRVFETPLNKATIGYTLKTSEWSSGMYLCVVYEGTSEKGSVRIVKE